MATYWICDICGKQTLVNPPTEQVVEEVTREIQVPSTVEKEVVEAGQKRMKKTVEFQTQTVTEKIPKMAKMKRQDPFTGEVQDVDVPELKDLKPRAYLVNLNVGHEMIQKDFCKECLEKVMPEVQALWDKLASIKSK